MAESELTV